MCERSDYAVNQARVVKEVTKGIKHDRLTPGRPEMPAECKRSRNYREMCVWGVAHPKKRKIF